MTEHSRSAAMDMQYRDFSKRLDSTVKAGGKQAEVDHYEWYYQQGVRLKARYRPRHLKKARS